MKLLILIIFLFSCTINTEQKSPSPNHEVILEISGVEVLNPLLIVDNDTIVPLGRKYGLDYSGTFNMYISVYLNTPITSHMLIKVDNNIVYQETKRVHMFRFGAE